MHVHRDIWALTCLRSSAALTLAKFGEKALTVDAIPMDARTIVEILGIIMIASRRKCVRTKKSELLKQ